MDRAPCGFTVLQLGPGLGGLRNFPMWGIAPTGQRKQTPPMAAFFPALGSSSPLDIISPFASRWSRAVSPFALSRCLSSKPVKKP